MVGGKCYSKQKRIQGTSEGGTERICSLRTKGGLKKEEQRSIGRYVCLFITWIHLSLRNHAEISEPFAGTYRLRNVHMPDVCIKQTSYSSQLSSTACSDPTRVELRVEGADRST